MCVEVKYVESKFGQCQTCARDLKCCKFETIVLRQMRLLTFSTISALACQLALLSVLAIDYGTKFITASLMKPGVPFDVLLNKDSKRKVSSSIAWKNGGRLFGKDSFNAVRTLCLSDEVSDFDSCLQGSRFPFDTFTYLNTLLDVFF